jgi:hypothetical protein
MGPLRSHVPITPPCANHLTLALAGTTTPPSVAADSDASPTIVIARRITVSGPWHLAQPPQVDLPEGLSQTEVNARNQVELHATTLRYIAMKKDSTAVSILMTGPMDGFRRLNRGLELPD